MTDDLIINARKRGTSSCLEPDTRLEVVEGKRIFVALERIAEALESEQTQTTQEGYTEEILDYCPVCGAKLKSTMVSIGCKDVSGLGEQVLEAQTIKYCSCGFVKVVGVK